MSEYDKMLADWKARGGNRPRVRPDGIPTRADMQFMTEAELAILNAVRAVERAGASVALTDAVVLLGQARERVADHVEAV